MITAYENNDTSLAFSIAVKVYFAVQFLHADLDIQQDPVKPLLHAISCEDSLKSIITKAKNSNWQ